ncbi:DUF3592 domain-containing protein [Streptomyces iconiensis]|uniref:DUF3592 domain-containing protein n=1 Tax=Streptomyces iconiensis TaxID=1384038 RepID=A0ABT6ZZE6_9ACTN|nr:DUF3592 domain-containing protein [Streptomyces iconiensis]MDJ1134440.1 DUF3592 domain-containing protein [Streptomyces iconiensis]
MQGEAGGETVWLLVLFLLAGPVIIGIGIYEAAHHRRLRREGIGTEGLVVRYRSERRQGSISYFAVVNFADAQGSPHEFESRVSGVKGLPVGGRAPVRYLPGAPQSARLDLAPKRFWSVALPVGIGIAFTAAGIWGVSTGL